MTVGVGPLLRDWREQRRLSQLALSSATGVSTRHLSCVETGRAAPSRELVLHLAAELDVPLRERNRLLLAAGYAPVFQERALDDAAMRPVAEVLATVVDRSDPNPTVIIDRHWNLVLANEAALWLCTGIAPELLAPPANVARLSLAPDGLAPRIRNLDEYSAHLLHRIRHTAALARDIELTALAEELEDSAPGHFEDAPAMSDRPSFALPLQIDVDHHRLTLFSTIATFGTAIDITLAELSIETFYPADDHTAAVLGQRPWRRAVDG